MSDWKRQCAELVAAWDSSAAEAANEARAELGLPEPKGPTDEELKTIAWKIYREAQEKDLRGDIALRVCRAVLARWGNPQPAPKKPTDEEITDLWSWSAGQDQGPWPTQAHCVVRVALQLWGSPPIEPVPASKKPWEREGWCDEAGKCWLFRNAGDCPLLETAGWELKQPEPWDVVCNLLSLPHWALPVPNPSLNPQ